MENTSRSRISKVDGLKTEALRLISALPAGSVAGRSTSDSFSIWMPKPFAPLSTTDFANVTPGMRAEPTVLHISLLRRQPLSEPRSSTASVE